MLKAKPKPIESKKNVEDVGMDPILNNNDMISPSKWSLEFRSLQQDIINCGIFVMSRWCIGPTFSFYLKVSIHLIQFIWRLSSGDYPSLKTHFLGQIQPLKMAKHLRQDWGKLHTLPIYKVHIFFSLKLFPSTLEVKWNLSYD